MHRSPLPVLVILAALAACSTHDAPATPELLAQDPTLVARLATDREVHPLPLPEACGTVAAAAPPAAADRSRAEELARQGYDAETMGNVEGARTLLRRASELDGTNGSAAYHLGRTSEALGDRAAAIAAYCRVLALTPATAESAEARQRVTTLSQPERHVAAAAVGTTDPTRRRAPVATPRHATPHRRTVEPRPLASATVGRAQLAAAPERGTHAPNAAASVTDAPVSPRDPVTGSPAGEGTAGRTAAGGDVMAAPDSAPAADEPSTASRTESRGPSRTQRAGIGAVAGAILGAVTGRGVKGALIGAAAGGVLGTATGGGFGPAGRGIRP